MSDRAPHTTADESHVLVVGDSEYTSLASGVLETRLPEATVSTTSTPQKAFRSLDRFERSEHRAIGAIVCDVTELDGPFSVIDEFRSTREQVPVVVIVEDKRAGEAFEAGATDVVSPGDDPSILVSHVRSAIERDRNRSTRDGDERYRSLLEQAGARILVCDEEGGIRFATSAVESAIGYTPDELTRFDLPRLVHPDDKRDFLETVDRVADEPTGSTEHQRLRLDHHDGTWRVFDVGVTNRLDDPAIDGLIVTIDDTVVPEPEENTVQDALDRLDAPFFAIGPNDEITAVNESASQVFDRTPAELRGTICWDLFSGSMREQFHDEIARARTTGSVVTFEQEFPALEQSFEIHVHPGETDVSVYAHERPDLSANQTGERRSVGHRRQTLEATLDALAAGVFVLDDRRIELANSAMFDLVETDVLVGRDLQEVFSADLADTLLERIRSPVTRWEDSIETTLQLADGTVSVSLSVVDLRSTGLTVCVVRERTTRFPSTGILSTIHRAIEGIHNSGSQTAVCRHLADAAVSLLDAELAAVYSSEGLSFEHVVTASRDTDERISLPAIEAHDGLLPGVMATGEPRVFDGQSFDSLGSRIGIRADQALIVPIAEYGFLLVTRTDTGEFSEDAIDLVDVLCDVGAIGLDRIDRTVSAHDRSRELDRARGRIDRLQELAACKRRVLAHLVEADDRETLEDSICTELTELDEVSFAWIGEKAVGTDEVQARAYSERAEEYVETITGSTDSTASDEYDSGQPEALEPAIRTTISGEVTAISDVGSVGGNPPWKTVAVGRLIGSILSVPLGYNGNRFGALTVYSLTESVFDDDVRDLLVDVGRLLGYGIDSLETERALLTDTITELELWLPEPTDPLSTIARRGSCTLEVQTTVSRQDEAWGFLTRVEGASAESIQQHASEIESIESVRVVEGDDADPVLEIVIDEETVFSTIMDHGGRLGSLIAEADRLQLTVEIPRSEDVSSIIRAITHFNSDVELRTRRDRERPIHTPGTFRSELYDRLTESQRSALETAFARGFFEWPRTQTGEEIAQSLGVSQPTFTRHFRAGERTLFSLLFEDQ